MTQNEKTTLALLRSGFSWQERSGRTDVRLDRLRELWLAMNPPRQGARAREQGWPTVQAFLGSLTHPLYSQTMPAERGELERRLPLSDHSS